MDVRKPIEVYTQSAETNLITQAMDRVGDLEKLRGQPALFDWDKRDKIISAESQINKSNVWTLSR